jgi:hypothetical protein
MIRLRPGRLAGAIPPLHPWTGSSYQPAETQNGLCDACGDFTPVRIISIRDPLPSVWEAEPITALPTIRTRCLCTWCDMAETWRARRDEALTSRERRMIYPPVVKIT